jgi:hypothetical protein
LNPQEVLLCKTRKFATFSFGLAALEQGYFYALIHLIQQYEKKYSAPKRNVWSQTANKIDVVHAWRPAKSQDSNNSQCFHPDEIESFSSNGEIGLGRDIRSILPLWIRGFLSRHVLKKGIKFRRDEVASIKAAMLLVP